MALGAKTGGRKKGTPNKMTASAKAAFSHAFTKIGGANALAKWAKENPGPFYTLYARLIPVDATVTHDGGINVTIEGL